MKKKNTYNPEFKSKVVLELLSGQHTLNELAEKYQISPATLSGWHKQFQDHAADVFRRGATDGIREADAKEREITVLQQKVCQLTIECDWLKKNMTKYLAPKERPKKYLVQVVLSMAVLQILGIFSLQQTYTF
jgi:transposase-like protein